MGVASLLQNKDFEALQLLHGKLFSASTWSHLGNQAQAGQGSEVKFSTIKFFNICLHQGIFNRPGVAGAAL